MTRGLVIGKFMPVHEGHLALIDFAAGKCDELFVSMSYTKSDPIDPVLRYSWLQEIFNDRPRIKPAMVADDFDDESLPLNERTRIWAAFIRNNFPRIDIIFSSEPYGDPFAFDLGASHVCYDLKRDLFPVSASKIRQQPFRYWDFIPFVVRPYFVRKICFYGPESTGKSEMAQRMAKAYNTEFVPEIAREFLTTNDFTKEDISVIAQAHCERILHKTKSANKILFCDTDAITTAIYSRYYLGMVPRIVFELEHKIHYHHYFLFDTDVPWVEDGLRDLPHKRREMFWLFRDALETRGIKYTLIQGHWQERENKVREVIDALLQ